MPSELVTAVFRVETEDGVVCATITARLRGISRGAAIAPLKEKVIEHYRTSMVEFKFWCDSRTSLSGCSPIEVSL